MSEEPKPNTEDGDSAAIGRNIRRLRQNRGWSQRRLAFLTDLTTQTIWRLERGEYDDQKLSTLRLIAEAFGVKVTALLEPEPNGEPVSKGAS